MATVTLPKHFEKEEKNTEVRMIIEFYSNGKLRVRNQYMPVGEIEQDILSTFSCTKEIAKCAARIVKQGRYGFCGGRTVFRIPPW